MAPFFTGLAKNLGGYGFGRSADGIIPSGVSATGGTQSPISGLEPGDGYRYHFFTASATPGFDVSSVTGSGEIEYIIIAGGGGGGGRVGGGGGAGGYREGSFIVSTGAYPVIVGNGGNGIPITYPNPSPGSNRGGDSTFNSITSVGGGSGASDNSPGTDPTGLLNGGSGGGNSGNASTPAGTGIPGQGNPGGTAPGTPSVAAGGGGGAGAAGNDAPSPDTLDGVGGIGKVGFSGIPPAYGTPGPTPGRWFAGGGGGGGYLVAAGGAGGGGAGGGNPTTSGTPATTNTGGGGGGGGYSFPQPSGYVSGNGASGIVIVRYLI